MDINIPVLSPEAAAQADVQKFQAPQPVTASKRIQTVDLIRGVALLGILLMNIPGFGITNAALFNILGGPHNNADFKTAAVILTLFDGTMRGLFSMLFGAGMILFTMNKKDVPGGATVAEFYYRRLLWLTAFGLFNAFVLLWWGDILFFYGLTGMLLFPFRKSSVKWLLLLGFLCLGINALKQIWAHNDILEKRIAYVAAVKAEKENKKLTPEQQAAKTEWIQIEKNRTPAPDRVNFHVDQMHSGYATIFNHFLPRNKNIEVWGTYHGIWDVLTMMFIGMALLMMGFFSNKLSGSTYLMCLLVGYGVGIPIGWILFQKGWVGAINIGAYMDAYTIPHTVLYDVRRILLSVGHASLILLIYRSRIVPWLMKGLAAVGQMAFTNYLMQSIICTLIFNGYGLGYYNNLRFYQLYYIVGAVWIFQIIFSAIWLRYYRFGPFEWLWRSLTYAKKQPMKVSNE